MFSIFSRLYLVGLLKPLCKPARCVFKLALARSRKNRGRKWREGFVVCGGLA
jgi:hypothetical protein